MNDIFLSSHIIKHIFFYPKLFWQVLIRVVSHLSTQLEPRSFVRTLPVGAYFRRSIPKCVL
jgi:hypothetical protein